MKHSDEIISKLKKLKEDNSINSYPHIKNILKNQRIPVAIIEYRPFKLIRFRRHNNGEEFFTNPEQLSYRKDILNIKNFGRANEPGQGFFYCNDNNNQNTGISEIVSVFRGNTESKEEILTIGAWNLKDSLNLAMILPSTENSGKHEQFDQMKEFYNNFEDSPEYEDLKNLNEFLANEFSLDLEKHSSNYKITCAFSNYIKETFPELDGLMYTSLKSNHEGINIVLWPEVVETKTEFFAAKKSVYKRIVDKTFVEVEIFDSKRFDNKKNEIIWK